MSPKYDFDKFWSPIWVAVWNALGLTVVVVGFCSLISYFAISELVKVQALGIPYVYESTPERRSLQAAFNGLIANEKRPCAVKNSGDKESNLEFCRLFRLRLGMGEYEATRILDESYYFAGKAYMRERCKVGEKHCVFTHWIYQSRDGFLMSVMFAPRSSEDKYPIVIQITLWFYASSHPYFDPEGLRATFVNLIGPPDSSDFGSSVWGKSPNTRMRVSITEDRTVAVILEK